MTLHAFLATMTRESLPEYLAVARMAMTRSDGMSREYGYPAGALMFMIASAIGSYYEGNASFKVHVDGRQVAITGSANHLFILNSDLYARQGLSQSRINRLYECFRGPLVHNAALAPNVILNSGDESGPVFYLADPNDPKIEVVNLRGFFGLTERAVEAFLLTSDIVTAQSKKAAEIYKKNQ